MSDGFIHKKKPLIFLLKCKLRLLKNRDGTNYVNRVRPAETFCQTIQTDRHTFHISMFTHADRPLLHNTDVGIFYNEHIHHGGCVEYTTRTVSLLPDLIGIAVSFGLGTFYFAGS